MPQPVPVVQHGGAGSQKVWNSALLCRFLLAQCASKKDSYPLPRIQKALESMAGTAHFSTMDFKSRFWQVKMAPESQQYTAFKVENLGFYEFTHMPFRLCYALMTFQCLMKETLGELNLTYCIIYLDDMRVFGHTEEEHLECLHIIFEWFPNVPFSNKRLYTWCIMFLMRGYAPAERMCMP